MSENRFLQSLSALLASAILVCGTHLLLIASSDYGRPESEQQLSPMAMLAPSAAPAAPREAIEVEVTGAVPDRSHSDTTPFAGDQTPAAPAPAEAVSSEPAPEPASEPVERAEAEAPSGETVPSPAIEEEKVASAAEPTPTVESITPAAEAVTPLVEPSEAPKPIEPAEAAQVEQTSPVTPQMTQAETPVAPAPVATEPEAPSASKLAEPDSTSQGTQTAVADPTSQSTRTAVMDSTSQGAQTAEVDTPPSTQTAQAEPASSSVPLPARKPELVANLKTAKAAAKQVASATEAEAQEAATESKPRWTPMALAPADKDAVGKPKVAPKRVDAGSYTAKIWSALARHKPRAGKAGSAAVTFSIGPAGGIRSVKISGSSGDSQLDQMALQTVRNAAPFPPPPDPASASYTIRIYFR